MRLRSRFCRRETLDAENPRLKQALEKKALEVALHEN